MTFTKTPPTNPGAYCLRSPEGTKFWCDFDSALWRIGDAATITSEEIVTNGGEWCGPLVPVEEVELAYNEGWSDGQNMRDWSETRARRIVVGEQL